MSVDYEEIEPVDNRGRGGAWLPGSLMLSDWGPVPCDQSDQSITVSLFLAFGNQSLRFA